MLISATTSYCAECRRVHPARYEEASGQIVYTIDCPRGAKSAVLSSDSQLFRRIRSDHLFPHDAPQPVAARRRSYFLEITDHCNLNCAICYAESGPQGKMYLSLEEVRDLGKRIRADGGRRISVSGGEPTVHPQLPQIIAILHGELGLTPYIVTNGLRISEDYEYLLRLKQAGLRKVKLQLDTLDSNTYRAMRGRDDLTEKHRAIQHVVSAGLRLGLVTTVCELNLAEVGGILRYAQTFVPPLDSLVFQPFLPIGRFPAALKSVTREDIIQSLARPGNGHGLQPGDFLPFARLRSPRGGVHPDCSAHVFMCVHRDRADPLPRDIDPGGPGDDSSGCPGLPQTEVAARALRSCDSCRAAATDCAEAVRSMKGLRRHGRRGSLFLVSVIAYMCPQTRDEQRLARCLVSTVTQRGFAGLCQRSCSGEARPRSHGGKAHHSGGPAELA